MAEGFLRELGGDGFEAHSAGLFPAGLHPKAVAVMLEEGIGISGQRSKEMDGALLREMDVVITLCGNAEKYCPITPPRIKRLHWPIKDPVGTAGTDEEIMKEFRRARDEIKERVMEFIKKGS